MLVDVIRQDMIAAWKAKDNLKKDTLNFLLSKIKNRGIDLKVEVVPDNEVLNIIQKMVKELNDELNSFVKANRQDKANDVAKQLLYINHYLPKQLTEEEINDIINSLEDKSVPSVMKYFKQNYSGQVDMSLVSKIARK